MSRSYKHTPRCGERKGKYSKNLANRRVRRRKFQDPFPQYAGYKKMFESWNICDFETVGETFAQFYKNELAWRRLSEPFPDVAEAKKQYEHMFIRK